MKAACMISSWTSGKMLFGRLAGPLIAARRRRRFSEIMTGPGSTDLSTKYSTNELEIVASKGTPLERDRTATIKGPARLVEVVCDKLSSGRLAEVVYQNFLRLRRVVTL